MSKKHLQLKTLDKRMHFKMTLYVCAYLLFSLNFFLHQIHLSFHFQLVYMANCRQNAQQRFALNILQQKQHVTCNKIKMNTYTRIHTHIHSVHCTANKMEASKNLRITNVMCHLGHSSELTLKIYDTLI